MIIGQEKIQRELNFILEDCRHGRNINLLLRAPSGYGKTLLGLIICQKLGINDCCYYIPDNNELKLNINLNKRVHFIDEVHLLKTPEMLYPLMDLQKYIFIFASNESGELKEALKNRCVQFIFEPYSWEEIKTLVRKSLSYSLTNELLDLIVSRTKLNPRLTKVLCNRLECIFRNYLTPETESELNAILENILNIHSEGLTEMDLRYLNYLQKVKRSSLSNIVSAIGIDKSTVLTEIEPYLLFSGKIKITSRGRECL